MGKHRSTGSLLFDPIEKEEFGKGASENYVQKREGMKGGDDTIAAFDTFRGTIQEAALDILDPRVAGWTYLLSEDEPLYNEIIQTIEKLATYRGMKRPGRPLTFNSSYVGDYLGWQNDNLIPDPLTNLPPYYLLIVGDPDLVPFEFQSMLSTALCVGRLDIDGEIENLKTYVDKVVEIETSPKPVVTDNTVFFAPDAGINAKGCSDPTFYSHHYMAQPLAKIVRESVNFKTTEIMDANATKQNLLDYAVRNSPSLVFTASHGTSPEKEDANDKKKYTGAIACQGYRGKQDDQTSLITADDLPVDQPFVKGGIFFQFACFSYGTPAISEIADWYLNKGGTAMKQMSPKPFVSSIPQKLLFNPNGPLAFVGHLDMALFNSFTDPKSPSPDADYDNRLYPFITLVKSLLRGNPVGISIHGQGGEKSLTVMKNYANAQFSSLYNRHLMKRIPEDQFYTQFADAYLDSTDAKNFMIFGDPAVKLNIRPTGM